MTRNKYQVLRDMSLTALTIFTLVACGGGGGSTASSTSQDAVSTPPASNTAPAPAPSPAPTASIPEEPPAVAVEVPTSLSKIAVKPTDIIYDASRGYYYASLGTGNSDKSDRIAIIDPTTGAQTLSGFIGTSPGLMAMSRDAKYLYVAINAGNEIVKLALPSLTVVSKISLGINSTNGILYASDIAVSPANSDIYAVAIRARRTSFQDVVLFNGTTDYPKKASDWSTDLRDRAMTDQIAFNSDGTSLFGYDSLTTGYSLRKLTVTSEGFAQALTRSTLVNAKSSGLSTPHFAMLGNDPMIAGSVFSGANLMPKGQFSTSLVCAPLSNAGKVACVNGDRVTVYDSATFSSLGTVESATIPYGDKKMVKGPQGQIAIIVNNGTITVGDTNPAELYLLGDAQLK